MTHETIYYSATQSSRIPPAFGLVWFGLVWSNIVLFVFRVLFVVSLRTPLLCFSTFMW